jgi:hypothetical protein
VVIGASVTPMQMAKNSPLRRRATSTAGPFFDLLDQMEALTITVELDWPRPPLRATAAPLCGRDGRMAPPGAEQKIGSTQEGNIPSNQSV